MGLVAMPYNASVVDYLFLCLTHGRDYLQLEPTLRAGWIAENTVTEWSLFSRHYRKRSCSQLSFAACSGKGRPP
jgi:hypothetical protein